MKWICALVGEYLYAKVALSNNNTKKTRSKRNRLTEMTLRFDKSMRYSSFPTEAEKNGEREKLFTNSNICRFCFCLLLLCGIMPIHFIISMASLMLTKHSHRFIFLISSLSRTLFFLFYTSHTFFYHETVCYSFLLIISVCKIQRETTFCVGIINIFSWNFKRLANASPYTLDWMQLCAINWNSSIFTNECRFCLTNCRMKWNAAVQPE